MRLISVETAHIPMMAEWMSRKENYQWLDFGAGRQKLDEVAIRVMTQRDLHVFRLYTADGEDRPVGAVGLSDVNRGFGTATAWCVLGEKEYARQGLTVRAVSAILDVGFQELGLDAINAWTLECNRGGEAILEHLNFNFIGRQRRCHTIDGEAYDRLWYDILAEEHTET